MKMMKTLKNVVYGTIVTGTALLTAYLGSGCGGVGSAPAVDTRSTFVQKTEAKFANTYPTRIYATGAAFVVNNQGQGINGSATSTESVDMTAADGSFLDIFLIDKSATGTFSALETQICAMTPPPTVICATAGQNVGTVIDTKYSGM